MMGTLEDITASPRDSSEQIVASLQAVNQSYGELKALRTIDFRVNAGQLVALLGPNSAGKTTLVKLLLDLLQPNSGKVRVFGRDPGNPENRMRTGAMLQVERVPETLRVRKHIEQFSSYDRDPMPAKQVLEIAGREKSEHRKFGELSGGQKQHVRSMGRIEVWKGSRVSSYVWKMEKID